MKQHIYQLAVRWLNRCTVAMYPKDRREWAKALISEQSQASGDGERVEWAMGGVGMGLRALLHETFQDRPVWATGLAFGIGAAVLDMRSTSRWPHVSALCIIAVLLACWKPNRVWRWTLLLALILPATVLLSNHWGPYAVDRFDVFYGAVPAAIGTLAGMLLGKLFDRERVESAGL